MLYSGAFIIPTLMYLSTRSNFSHHELAATGSYFILIHNYGEFTIAKLMGKWIKETISSKEMNLNQYQEKDNYLKKTIIYKNNEIQVS